MSKLTQLEKLYLYDNQLTGTIPDLSALINLEILSLYENELTGPIPDLSTLINLTQLYLYANQLTGPIPDLDLPELTTLYLQYNELDGEIPALDLPELTALYLQNNQLTGPIPALSALTKLKYLHLQNNQLTGPIPDGSGTPLLEQLLLYNNQLTGSIPDLSTLTQLAYLYLHGTNWGGDWPEGVPLALRNKTGLTLHTNRRPVPPEVKDQTVLVGEDFEYPVVFSDPDLDTLSYEATLAGATPDDDTPLPEWLTIDATGTLSGTPPMDLVDQSLMVRVSATDGVNPTGTPPTPTLSASAIVTLSGRAESAAMRPRGQ